MWAMQWLTGTKGIFNAWERVLAKVAPVLKQGPRPGPWEKAITFISFNFKPDFSIAEENTFIAFLEWDWAASLGCIPPFKGSYIDFSLANISPFEETIPMPKVFPPFSF